MQSRRVNRTVGYALSRPVAYLIVLLMFAAIIVAIVGHWPLWTIGASVVAGAVLLGLWVLDSLSDPHAEEDAFLADLDLSQLRDKALRDKVRQGLEYINAAKKLARRDTSGVLDAADDELPQMQEAVRSMLQMALRLQDFRADQLIQRDLAGLRQQEQRMGRLSADQQEQLESLRRLDAVVRDGEREIDGALAQLGRSYAEMQAIRVTPEFRGQAADVLQELKSSTKRLSDLAQGYDEAYGSRAPSGARTRG